MTRKWLAIALFLAFGTSIAKAELFSSDAKLSVAGVTFQIPINNLSAISMVSLWGNKPITMIGGETPVVFWKDITGSIVLVTNGDNTGAWGGALNYDWAKLIPNLPLTQLNVGIFVAENFDTNTFFVGLKAAQKFW